MIFRLPVCPYCNTVYSYSEVKKSVGKRKRECYHCKNFFRPNLGKKVIFTGLLFLILTLIFNLIIINLLSERNISVIPLFFVDIIPIAVFLLLIPFLTEFRKIKDINIKKVPTVDAASEKKLKRSEKNRKRKEVMNK